MLIPPWENLFFDASVIPKVDNPLLTPPPLLEKVINSPRETTTTPGNNKGPINRPPLSMDEIWDTLMNINTSIDNAAKKPNGCST